MDTLYMEHLGIWSNYIVTSRTDQRPLSLVASRWFREAPELGPRLFSGDQGEGEKQQFVKIYFGGCKKPVTVYK